MAITFPGYFSWAHPTALCAKQLLYAHRFFLLSLLCSHRPEKLSQRPQHRNEDNVFAPKTGVLQSPVAASTRTAPAGEEEARKHGVVANPVASSYSKAGRPLITARDETKPWARRRNGSSGGRSSCRPRIAGRANVLVAAGAFLPPQPASTETVWPRVARAAALPQL